MVVAQADEYRRRCKSLAYSVFCSISWVIHGADTHGDRLARRRREIVSPPCHEVEYHGQFFRGFIPSDMDAAY